MRIALTPLGIPEILLFCGLFATAAVALVLALPGVLGIGLALVPIAGFAFVINFFRDPDRTPEGDADAVCSPADGTVTDIIEVEDVPFVGGPATRIGIFLSVFDVHVNRAPVAGEVAYKHHRPGAFLDARDPACADENEAQDLGIRVDDGEGGDFPVLVRQIAGLIARRIRCPVAEGARLERGQRYGMIKFGSRTEVYIPTDRVAGIDVKLGDKLKGGRHQIARLRRGAAAAPAAARVAGAESAEDPR